jgi:hypothetical protein
MNDKLHNDDTLAERSGLQAEAIMDLLEVCLRTTCFQVDDKFFQQISLSPIVSNIYKEYFEKLALNLARYKPSLWLRYIDDTFVVWPHVPDLQYFLSDLSSLKPAIHPFHHEN